MHKFLRAVGFSQYTEKKQVQKLIRDIIIHADELYNRWKKDAGCRI